MLRPRPRRAAPAPRTLLALLSLPLWIACGDASTAGERASDSPGAAAPSPAPAAPAAPAAAPPAAPAAAPAGELLAEIECPAPVRDFGRVWEGVELTHEFRFRAAGEHDLVIANYRTDCGCTVAHLEVLQPEGGRVAYEKGTPLPPGTELALGVAFDTRTRPGRQRKTVDVYANVEGGVREMALVADVRPLLTVEPAMVALDEMSVRETRRGEARVTAVADEPFRLMPPEAQLPDALAVELEPVEPDADGRARAWVVRVVAGPGMPTGLRTYPLEMETDLAVDEAALGVEPGPRTVLLRVSVRVFGLVSLDQQNVSFGMVAPDQTVARTLVLRSRDPEFELPEPGVVVKPHKEGASAAFLRTLHVTKRRMEDGAWEIELLLEGLDPEVERSFHGRVVVETGHPEEPILEAVLSGLKQGI